MTREDVIQHDISSEVETASASSSADQRRHVRVPVSIGAEIIDSKTGLRITGRATDVGVGGCYVDTTNTVPKGTAVDVFLHWQDRTLQMRALVSYVANSGSIGMGLSFTGASAEAGATLLEWVTGLGSENRPTISAPAKSAGRTSAPGEIRRPDTRGLDDVLGELVALLVRRQLISEREGAQLRDRIFER